MIEKIWYVKGINIFDEIADYEIRMLEQRSKLRKYKTYELVCDQSNALSCIYVVKSGSVKIYKPEPKEDDSQKKPDDQKRSEFMTAGNDLFSQLMSAGESDETTTNKPLKPLSVTLKSGEFFGTIPNRNHSSVVDLSPSAIGSDDVVPDFVVEAMDDLEIYLARRSAIKLLFKYSTDRLITIDKSAGLRNKYKLKNRIQNLIDRDVVSRLASLLLHFTKKYSRWKSSKSVLDFKLSTKELAKLVGATNEDVDQVLELLKREKIISIKRKKIEVLNGWKLKKWAERRRRESYKQSPL